MVTTPLCVGPSSLLPLNTSSYLALMCGRTANDTQPVLPVSSTPTGMARPPTSRSRKTTRPARPSLRTARRPEMTSVRPTRMTFFDSTIDSVGCARSGTTPALAVPASASVAAVATAAPVATRVRDLRIFLLKVQPRAIQAPGGYTGIATQVPGPLLRRTHDWNRHGNNALMATDKQKEAARRNIGKAREAQSARAHGEDVPSHSEGLSTAEKDRLDDQEFAFPKERKEPLIDASHVRNAIARFDQVEGVSDTERDQAWKRILAAAKRFDVEVSEADWRDLAKGGKDRRG
jgi:hypothetical protein